ncbi:MAG: PH domain-containing protein [Gammaproteobacteria bacterium]
MQRSQLALSTYRLAPMSTGILVLTVLLMLVPLALFLLAITKALAFLWVFLLVGTVYAWVWLLFRPTAFVVHPNRLEIVWPMKRRKISLSSIQAVRLIDATALKREIGWGIRIGAGGLWGGFGWLWTRRRGIVQMYLSRTNDLVWIERGKERSWLITPERAEEFVRQLSRKTAPDR